MLLQILTMMTKPVTPYPIKGDEIPQIEVVKELADGSYERKEFTDIYQAILYQCRTGAEQLMIDFEPCGTAWTALDDAQRATFGSEIYLERIQTSTGGYRWHGVMKNERSLTKLIRCDGETTRVKKQNSSVVRVICDEKGLKRLTQSLKVINAPKPKVKRNKPKGCKSGLDSKAAPNPYFDLAPLSAAEFVQAVMIVPQGIKLYLRGVTAAEQRVLPSLQTAVEQMGLTYKVKSELLFEERDFQGNPIEPIAEVAYSFPLKTYYDLVDQVNLLRPKYVRLLAAENDLISTELAYQEEEAKAMQAYYEAMNDEEEEFDSEEDV